MDFEMIFNTRIQEQKNKKNKNNVNKKKWWKEHDIYFSIIRLY